MGDLRNKRKKLEQEQAIKDADDRRAHGWTVFYFDYNPRLVRRDLKLGEAVRHLLRITNTRLSWWRCPVRGLAIQYRKLPTSRYAHDNGETYVLLRFSDLPNETEAKKALALDLLMVGIELYRGLPNRLFAEEVELIRWLLTAPPSITAKVWLEAKRRLDARAQPLLRTHEAELRKHLLGEKYTGRSGSAVTLTAKARLEEIEAQHREGDFNGTV